MNFSDAEKLSRPIQEVERLDREIVHLNQADQQGSNFIPGMFSSEIDPGPSLENAQKIREILRVDAQQKRQAALAELTRLGVDVKAAA
jgi:hypothetical protein